MPRSYWMYRGDCTSPTTVYSLWAKCSRSPRALSWDRRITLPTTDFPKLPLSRTHSAPVSGSLPDTSFRVLSVSGML